MFARVPTHAYISYIHFWVQLGTCGYNRSKYTGLCLFVRKDFNFSIIDVSRLAHHSAEILGIRVQCSLDSPVVLLNMYRHPNSSTPFSFFRSLFSFISTHKYAILLGDYLIRTILLGTMGGKIDQVNIFSGILKLSTW